MSRSPLPWTAKESSERRTAWNSTLSRSKPLERTQWQRPLSVVVPGGAPVVQLRRTSGRKDTIPPKVRSAVHDRDGRCCFLCGGYFGEPGIFGIHLHHRRLKQDGGDPRPHTDCPCNLVSLCRICHDRVHNTGKGRVLAEAEGLIIPNVTLEPGKLSVLVHGEDDGSGCTAWLTCDGHRVTEAPGGAA